MTGQQLFCQDHWDELVPDIKANKVNGIALQPLAMEALLAHDDVHDEFADVIGERNDDTDAVVSDASPVCCWLDGRTRYSEGTDYKDDYALLIEAGTAPLEEVPDSFWAGDD